MESKGSATFAEKMKEQKWIKTEQVIECLKNEPNVEQEYRHHLGGRMCTTHWLEYSSQSGEICDSRDWNSDVWFTEAEFLEMHVDEWWMREG